MNIGEHPKRSATMSATEDRIFTVREAAAYLRISRGQIYYLMKRGELSPFHIGTRTLFTGAEIARFVAHAMERAS
jgi:excisionase family DNA binding protein